jgi:hypothetical protein
MAADQERADRIRLLKRDNPQLKWRHIADHVGVELRSAQMWQETGAISYENAKKLAELVGDPAHDVDWIMRGPRESERAPSPFAGQDALADRLDQMEALIAKQNELLARQSQILKRIEAKLGQDERAAERIEDISESLDAAVQSAIQGLESSMRRTPQATPKTARTRIPRASS